LGSGSRGQFNLSLSTQPGQPDRIIRVRASGGSAQLDFGRDLYWEERTQTENPIFDAYAVAVATSRQLRSSAGRDRRRRITAALRKALGSEPFSESIARSISTFYANIETGLDNRHDWKFGASTIQLCEEVCASAGMGQPSALPISVSVPRTDSSAPATVLVVGGTGFIGRALVAKLIDNGVRVRVLSRSRNAAAIAFAGMPVEVCEGSHGSRGDARKALAGIEVVFHLAKCEGKRWDDYLKGDIEPTRVLAEESVAAGVKRFIYTGTIDSYDSATPRNRITGDTPVDAHINRRNLYARSKAACEKILHELGRAHGLPVIVLRPAIVIGAGAPPAHNGIAQFASETDVRYWGRGDNKLPLVLVDDVADALAAAAEAPGIIGRSFVLTSEPMMSAREYVRELEASSGVKIRDRRRSPWRYWVADVIKEIAKNVIRHPNRRWPSLHDWRCRAHRSTYDNSGARDALAWEPVTDRSILVERGIQTAVASSIK
jgi:nucleoside-diphosphate-sugar epimerase